MYGKLHSEESKKLMSKSHKENDTSGSNNPFFGKTHTKEVREKLRLINKNNQPHAKEYKILSPNGIIYTGTNINKFCREHNLSSSSMCLVRTGKKESFNGWTFII